jgi:hypothetical protein
MVMTKTIELEKNGGANPVRTSHQSHKHESVEEPKPLPDLIDPKSGLAENERELLNEVLRAVRTINYGSIVLTIHESRLVEISKTIRLRKNLPAR